jgi:hypothetical protein
VFASYLPVFEVTMSAPEPANVTLVQLIANPEKFDGKLVRVIGFLRLEFEGNVLYLHREDYDHAIFGNGIWVDVTPEMTKHREVLQMHYVLLEGIFNSKNRGHMGMWSGSLTKIQRAEAWVAVRPQRTNS